MTVNPTDSADSTTGTPAQTVNVNGKVCTSHKQNTANIFVGDITDTDFRKIRLPCSGAQRRKFRAVQHDHIVVVRMFIREPLQQFRCVIILIPCIFVAKQRNAFQFFFCPAHKCSWFYFKTGWISNCLFFMNTYIFHRKTAGTLSQKHIKETVHLFGEREPLYFQSARTYAPALSVLSLQTTYFSQHDQGIPLDPVFRFF
jgi:hypothetical protein